MKKITYCMILITVLIFLGLNISESPLSSEKALEEGRDVYLNIMVVNKPQYYMVKEIVGDKHSIEYLIKEEKEEESFKYNKDVVSNISKMDLFIYSSLNLKGELAKLKNELRSSNIGNIDISRGVKTLYDTNANDEKINPYYLGVEEYKIALYNIKAAIQDKDPKNRDYYEENYNKSITKLDEKIYEYNSINFKKDDIMFVATSNKFNYFLNAIGVEAAIKDEESIKELVESDYDREIVIIKESKEKSLVKGFKEINLESYNSDASFLQVIEKNIDTFTNCIKNYNSENKDKE